MMKQPRLRAWRLARASRRGERQTPPSAAPDPPAMAAKADDLVEIKKAVEDAASVSGGLWLSYLFVLSYIAIAAGAVTHEDLLLERPVKLPFLNVELPLLAFFALAPFVVLIIHAYALMHFIMLGKKASRFHNELRHQFPDCETEIQRGGAAPEGASKEIRDKLRRLLPSNIFVQILAGPPELRGGIFGSMLKLIALTTLVALPVLVLLLLQIQFLPFHDVNITNAQRAALFLDIVLLWLLRPPILANLDESPQRVKFISRRLRAFGLAFASVTSIATIWFSFMLATIPNEWRSGPLSYVAAIEPKAANKLVFGVAGPKTALITGSWPANTLRLQDFDIYEALKVDDPKKLDWKDHTFDLHSRQLEGAVFHRAKLGKVDLKEAHLEGALMYEAKLQGASLDRAHLQGASLDQAQLQGASLYQAELQGASLRGAQLQGASLNFAQLQGASLSEARLQGASLWSAELQGASLEFAQLQGASLDAARLQGASLSKAQLQGASLYGSLGQERLQAPSKAQLQGAPLYGASLYGAKVNATDFWDAFLWRTNWGWGEIDQAELGAVRLDAALERWKPIWEKETFSGLISWTDKTYADLRVSMNSIPEGNMRDEALKRIETLDCANKTLASCNPAAEPPPEVLNWQKTLLKAKANVGDFEKALATELGALFCANDADAIHILRGTITSTGTSSRLAWAGCEAPTLVDSIVRPKTVEDCPVSASLTNDDKAKLLQIKQFWEKKCAPPTASKKEK
jgi:uncharacterized protein YjbI with pentapeptide repeats